ncbi:MAG: rhomboid family intramembrane serine protease [Chlamydiia bacterium]|nr:rhomboid family intramembrane serine protease [Chlamydiia bacterium]
MQAARHFKILLVLTGAVGIFSPLLLRILALSYEGVMQGYLWQFVSYLFVEPTATNNFGSLLHLAFNLFLLWTFGNGLLERGKAGWFYGLYFSAGLVASLIAFGLMALSHNRVLLAGNSPALYATLIGWTLLNPNAKLLLFFSLPFRAAWLLLGLIGANLLIDLTNGNWILFCSYASACLFAYLYSLIAWRAESWLPFLQPFERMVFRLIERGKHLFSKEKRFRKSKIYDFKSGRPILDDEEFLDAMLTRISLYGEEALSPAEKERMQKISAKKR